jgi:hypothetical protein
MFVVEIKPLSGSRSKYVGEGNLLTLAKKEALTFDKDTAELTKKTICILHGFSAQNVFVVDESKIRKSTNNKYGAKIAYWDEFRREIVDVQPERDFKRFDSIFEAKVYQLLRQKYPKNNVVCQYPLRIKPATAKYKELCWAVDFAVTHEKTRFYVEAKGLALPEFRRNLQYLQFFNDVAWNNTYIVCETSTRIDQQVRALSFKEFAYKLSNNQL